MTTSEQAKSTPLWLSMEEKILGFDAQSLSGDSLEAAIQKVAGELDAAGYNVSGHGGNMLRLRWAMADMTAVGRPMMKDVNDATSALTLEDVAAPFVATDQLIQDIGGTWPKIKKSECRVEVVRLVEETRLNLLVAKAKEMSPQGGTPDGTGDEGIRYLLGEKVDAEVIISSLEITQERLNEVIAAIKAEQAEIARVEKLLEAVDGKSDEERVKHFLENNVAEALILEMAKVDQGAIDGAKKAMEEELKEKQRLAEEEAARKKKAAEGPSLADIPHDELVDHIDAVREILEFSDVEKEIRVMCEQSAIPQALVDIAVSDPDKLDELEKAGAAGGAGEATGAKPEAAPAKPVDEGPSLDDIPSDQLLEHIEGVREILEFSDVEKEIRVMCEQSAIPKVLVDIAVSDPDKLDELEKSAEG